MKRIVGSAVLAMAAWMLSPSPAAAHNPSIHQAMTDLAWQMMVVVENTGGERIGEGGDDWQGFLRRVAATPGRYSTLLADLYPLVSSRTYKARRRPAPAILGTGPSTACRMRLAGTSRILTGCGVKHREAKPDNVLANQFGGAVRGLGGLSRSAFRYYTTTAATGDQRGGALERRMTSSTKPPKTR